MAEDHSKVSFSEKQRCAQNLSLAHQSWLPLQAKLQRHHAIFSSLPV